MKKNVFILAGSLALCLGTAQAQQRDSTQTDRSSRTNQSDQARQPRDKQNQSTSYNSGDVEILKNEEIPASLRQALDADEKYAGWENAIIYHNKRTGEYLVSPRAHRFDSEGNAIDYPGQKPSKRMKASGKDATMKQQRDQSGTDQQSSQQRRQSQYGNDQSGVDQNSGAVSSDRTTPQQDTTQSSQMESTTDQGRQQSTSGRMQQDTASESTSQGQYGNQSGQDRRTANQQSSTQQSDAYRTDRNTENANGADVNLEGMTVIQTSEIPVALKETLTDDQYKGWEGGKLYRHESTGEYVLVMEEKTAGEGNKTYRFDREGKLMNGSSRDGHQQKN